MFKINNIDWKVKLVSPNHPKIKRSDGSYTYGSCDDNTKTIYISQSVPRGKIKKVICHEVTHAAMFSYGVELSLEQEEIIADLIATYGKEIIDVTNKIFNRIS